MMEERTSFTIDELKIVMAFENGQSIRKISEANPNFGRTKIKNILIEYARIFPEKSENIERLLLAGKTHKNVSEVDDYKEMEELTQDEIKIIYDRIRNGETLTAISSEYGRTRDYIKKRVIDYLSDEQDIQELLEILRDNQHKSGKNKYVEFFSQSETDKIVTIFNRLNARKVKTNRKVYSFLFLTKKYKRLRDYLLFERNESIENEEDRLSEDDFFKMLYDSPTLLSSSFSDKIRPAIEHLDSHPDIGIVRATQIIKEDASILFSSIDRTNLQIKILNDSRMLDVFLAKPRNFRTSPELIYALIEYSKTRKINSVRDVFLTKSQLLTKYGMEADELIERFDVRKKYDDKYLERE